MSKELRIGATEPAPDSPAFAISRDSGGILIGVRDNAAPQFGVTRDSGGLLLSAWPVTPAVATYTYTVPLIDVLSLTDLYVRSWSNVMDYEAARAGSEHTQSLTTSWLNHYYYVGQQGPQSEVYQSYLRFDTSAIPDDETVTGAVLTAFFYGDSSDTDFTIEARVYDAGDTVTTADYVAGASLGALSLFATLSTVGGLALSVEGGEVHPVGFIEAAGAAAAINKTGITGLLLCSDRTRTDVAPTDNEYVQLHAADGGEVDAFLTITTNGPA